MRKLMALAALALAVTLGACNLPTLNVASQTNMNTEAGILAAYGVVINAENAYKTLPLCRTGTTPSITNICAKRSVIVRLQSADRIANTAVNQMVLFIKTNPNISPASYISAAQSAISSIQTILNAESAEQNRIAS